MKVLTRIVLAAALLAPAAALARSPKADVAPKGVQTEFDGFIAKFRAALKADDSAAVAGMTRLPFMNDENSSDAAKFRAKTYPDIFDKRSRACLQKTKAIYAADGDKNHTYSIFCAGSIYTFTKTPTGFQFTDIGVND